MALYQAPPRARGANFFFNSVGGLTDRRGFWRGIRNFAFRPARGAGGAAEQPTPPSTAWRRVQSDGGIGRTANTAIQWTPPPSGGRRRSFTAPTVAVESACGHQTGSNCLPMAVAAGRRPGAPVVQPRQDRPTPANMEGPDAEPGPQRGQGDGRRCAPAASRTLGYVPPTPFAGLPWVSGQAVPGTGVHSVPRGGGHPRAPQHILLRCPCLAGLRLRKFGNIYVDPTRLQDDDVVAALARGFRRHLEPMADGRP